MKKKRSIFPLDFRDCRGMITVETSVIVPILFFLTAGLLFFQLFMIDMAAAKSGAMQTAVESAASWKTGSQSATGTYQVKDLLDRDQDYLKNSQADSKCLKNARTGIRRKMSGSFLLVRASSSSASIRNGKVQVREKMYFHLPVKGAVHYLGRQGWHFSCSQTAVVDDWQEALRKGCAVK